MIHKHLALTLATYETKMWSSSDSDTGYQLYSRTYSYAINIGRGLLSQTILYASWEAQEHQADWNSFKV